MSFHDQLQKNKCWTFVNPASDIRKQQNHDLRGILLPELEHRIATPYHRCEGHPQKLQQVHCF